MSAQAWSAEEDAAFRAAADGDPGLNGHDPNTPRVVSVQEFASVDEPGADALVGGEDGALIPEGGDVLIYGDGGAGKTTLSVDLAFSLGTGKDWLDIHVARPVRVLLIENEGPRALFRRKLRRKLDSWTDPLEARVSIFEDPWGEFTFADPAWRTRLAGTIATNEVDVLIIGPVTRSGMNEAGTLQEVRDFMALVADVRVTSGRRVTVVLIHHENKGGTVSGAWEGSGDTLLHVEARGNGFTCLHVQKARWSSHHHKATFDLVWTDGDGFAIKADRNMLDEIEQLLADGKWRTAKQIAAPRDAREAGIGANVDSVRDELERLAGRFTSRTGDAAKQVGRHPSATVWQVTQAAKSPESPTDFQGGDEGQVTPDFPLRKSGPPESPPQPAPTLTRPAESPAGAVPETGRSRTPQPVRSLQAVEDADAEYARVAAKFGEDGAAA